MILLPPLAAVGALVLALGASGPARGDGGLGALITPEAREAIERGTRFLLRTQNADGSWTSDAGKKINETYRPFEGGVRVPHVGVTALASLALLAGGHLPGRGPKGEALDRAVDFLLAQVQPSGYVSAHHTRMYSHAFATLALAEVYGVSRREDVRKKLQKAVELTVKAQNATGGWRYVPLTNDSDLSVTVCQVVALRAARNVGMKVPQATIDRALRYVIESAITTEDRSRGSPGAFWYQPQDQTYNRDSFSLCAAGLTTLFQAGLYDDRSMREHIRQHGIDKPVPPSIHRSVRYMDEQYQVVWNGNPGAEHYFYYYGNYYAMQAMYQIGASRPELWRAWYSRVRDDLLTTQRTGRPEAGAPPESWWVSNVDDTHAFATAVALLLLQFPLDHLPIHQR